MLLLLEFGYISVVQWYRRQQRRTLYLAAVDRIWQTRSIVVNKIPTCSNSDRQPTQLSDSAERVACPLHAIFQDDRISMSLLASRKMVNLKSWIKLSNSFECSPQEVNLLLELKETFVKCPQIQESLLKEPLAWKSGCAGTSVVFGCTLNDFICLCERLPEGINFNEQLNVHTMTTIGVEWESNPKIAAELDSRHVQPSGPTPTGKRDFPPKSSDFKNKSSGQAHSPKPPNILIYCGKVNSVRGFEAIRETMRAVVNTDAYTIYHLKHDEVHGTPWKENAALLVIAANNLYDGLEDVFVSFFDTGGLFLSFGSSLEHSFIERKNVRPHAEISTFDMTLKKDSWSGIKCVRGRFNYSRTSGRPDLNVTVMAEDGNEPVIVGVRKSDLNTEVGQAVFSQVLLGEDPTEIATNAKMFDELKPFNSTRISILQYLLRWLGIDCQEGSAPSLTPAYLLARSPEVKTSLLASLEKRLKDGCLKSQSLTLQFLRNPDEMNNVGVSRTHLPVVCSGEPELMYFKPEVFWQNLTSSALGHVLIYADVLPTTMALLEALQFSVPEDRGLIVVAGRQTTGKGRGQNAWLSPVGCAMFSLHVRVDLDSNLGQRVSFLQHIASLSVVLAVTTMPGYEDLDLKLKWPNDIYYGSKMKLGGVIVNSTIMGPTIHAVVGCGFNVDNRVPTICINDLIHVNNKQKGTQLPACSMEQLIARTVNHMEMLIEDFQRHGHEAFCLKYYEHWLHAGARVRLERAGGQTVSIVGLDSFGFLQVRTDTGEMLSVMPDGNSFDIMHNLISMKS